MEAILLKPRPTLQVCQLHHYRYKPVVKRALRLTCKNGSTSGGNVLCAGSFKNVPGNPPISGGGTRMMWYPDKAAFRAGYVESSNWDKDSIGSYSFAIGSNTKAKGSASIAMGDNTIAWESVPSPWGRNNCFRGTFNVMGYNSTASGSSSIAMGYNTKALGNTSTAMGNTTTASGNYSTSMDLTQLLRDSIPLQWADLQMPLVTILCDQFNFWYWPDVVNVLSKFQAQHP